MLGVIILMRDTASLRCGCVQLVSSRQGTPSIARAGIQKLTKPFPSSCRAITFLLACMACMHASATQPMMHAHVAIAPACPAWGVRRLQG